MSKLRKFHFEFDEREIHSWIGDSFFLFNESKILLSAGCCTSPHLQTGPWLVEKQLQQQSHQSKDRLRMGPTQSWSQPPLIFSCGATWKIESTKRTLEPLVSSNQTSKQRLKPLTKKPAALWCPTSSAAWRCVSSRKGDIWRNCCRTGYTPVIVLRFYVIIFIHIKSIIFNFCFIVSIFVIVRIFLNNFQKLTGHRGVYLR